MVPHARWHVQVANIEREAVGLTYLHSMQTKIEGIQALRPAKWRSLDGIVGVHWEAEGHAGASGYYLSPDPRIVFFFNDVSTHIRVSNRPDDLRHCERGMARVIYVPAGMPMWTSFADHHRFSHLDLHLHKDRMMRYVAPVVGSSAARSALKQPVELQDPGPLSALATLIVDELSTDIRHPVFAENLVGAVVTGILNLRADDERPKAGAGRLTRHISTDCRPILPMAVAGP